MNVFNFLGRCFTFLVFILPASRALAEERNRSVISYFVDNIVFQTLYSGGYYTLLVILVLSIVSYFFKKFKQIFLSILLAIFGFFLLIFLYESLEDFEFIPPVYT
jgi:hypothetical protein